MTRLYWQTWFFAAEQKQNTMRKTVITYGLLSGAIVLILWFLGQRFMTSADGKIDFSKGELFGYAGMIISLTMVFFGVRHYRDKYVEGRINFGKAFWVGFQIALVAALIYMAGWMIYYNTSDNGQQHLAQYMDYMKQQWAESGMPAEEVASKTAAFEKNMAMMKNPIIMALMTIFEILPVGIIVALISALILKSRRVESRE
jgi:hypothetical protein